MYVVMYLVSSGRTPVEIFFSFVFCRKTVTLFTSTAQSSRLNHTYTACGSHSLSGGKLIALNTPASYKNSNGYGQ